MTKVLTLSKASSNNETAKKHNKKQTRLEAKIQDKLEQAKKGVQKATSRVAKAQSRLEMRASRLHRLEHKLAQLHPTPTPEPEPATPPVASIAVTEVLPLSEEQSIPSETPVSTAETPVIQADIIPSAEETPEA